MPRRGWRVPMVMSLLLLAACAPQTPAATPAPPALEAVPSQAPTDPCAGVPAPTSGSIAPSCGGVQERFDMDIWGFDADEQVGFWLDSWEHGMIAGTRETMSIGPSGSAEGLYFYPSEFELRPGTYQWVFQGVASGHQSVLPFRVLP